eukprot:403341585
MKKNVALFALVTCGIISMLSSQILASDQLLVDSNSHVRVTQADDSSLLQNSVEVEASATVDLHHDQDSEVNVHSNSSSINSRVRTQYRSQDALDQLGETSSALLNLRSRSYNRLNYGYYSYNYGFFNSSDWACRPMNCTHCCENGVCQEDARCVEMTKTDPRATFFIYCFWAMFGCLIMVFILNSVKRRQHTVLINKLQSMSAGQTSNSTTDGYQKVQ